MKVKCIKNDCWNNYLTIGKIYDVIRISELGNYLIINEYGFENWVNKELFKPLSEYRNEKIDMLLK